MNTCGSQVEARFARLEKSLLRTRLAASGRAIALHPRHRAAEHELSRDQLDDLTYAVESELRAKG
jgi:hypothetical protein